MSNHLTKSLKNLILTAAVLSATILALAPTAKALSIGVDVFAGAPFSNISHDVDGDGLADFKAHVPGSGEIALYAVGDFGINSGFYRGTATDVVPDGIPGYFRLDHFNGISLPSWGSDDNWTKVHFTTGDGWVQWLLGPALGGRGSITSAIPLQFVLESPGENLTPAGASGGGTSAVPDGGSTLALLGLAMTGVAAVRRKLRLV
jgi:hypothetical protein